MGTRVTYVGVFADGVEIAETGQYVGRGETVEVDSELAEALLAQETSWARPTTKAAKATASNKRPAAPAASAHDPAISPAVGETVSDDKATEIDESQEGNVNA